MASLPRPLLALLAVVLAVFAAWMTVLKPSSSSSSNPPAPAVVVHSGGSSVHTQAKAKAASGASASASSPAHPATVSPSQRRVNAVDAALRKDQVVALLFYNPAGADDKADRAEIAAIPTHHGKVFKLAIPVQEVTRYTVITDQVPVTGTPTLVVVDSHHRATTLVGFADQLEINQLVAGALVAK